MLIRNNMHTITKRVINSIIRRLRYFIRLIINTNHSKIEGIKLNTKHPQISNKLKRKILIEEYENHEIKIIKSTLESDDKIVEIGSGIGFISAFCGKEVGQLNVTAIEANPSLIEIAKETFEENNMSIEILNFAIGEENGVTPFYIEDDFWSSSSIKRSDRAKKIEIPTKKIDDVLEEITANYLIIDIEGYEKILIDKKIPNKIKKICIELHPHIIGKEETSKVIRSLLYNNFIIDTKMTSNDVFYFYRK